jgi:hypothetical protein
MKIDFKGYFKKAFCNHKWADTDPIGVDVIGGFHKCVKCGDETYIYWGWHHQILKWLGKIYYE